MLHPCSTLETFLRTAHQNQGKLGPVDLLSPLSIGFPPGAGGLFPCTYAKPPPPPPPPLLCLPPWGPPPGSGANGHVTFGCYPSLSPTATGLFTDQATLSAAWLHVRQQMALHGFLQQHGVQQEDLIQPQAFGESSPDNCMLYKDVQQRKQPPASPRPSSCDVSPQMLKAEDQQLAPPLHHRPPSSLDTEEVVDVMEEEEEDNASDAKFTPGGVSSPSSGTSQGGETVPCTSEVHTTGVTGRKKRRSGFQSGVTVGYTYDAFFVSDGRSKRRNTSDRETPGELPDQPQQPLKNDHQLQQQSRHRYTCPECGKDYATSSNLSRHKQTHRSLDSQQARKCSHCDKVYVSMPALAMHILTHDLRHTCPQCGKAFSRPWLLQGHLRAHSGEKPYGCAHCGRAFADRSNLRAHMQTHSAEKQFRCDVCRKTFALKSYLNKHIEASCNGKQSGPGEMEG